MAEAFPTQFHDLGALEELPPAKWRDLCNAFGYPSGLNSTNVCGARIHEALVRSVVFSDELIDALNFIYDLGTDTGREHLVETARALNIDSRGWPDESPRELAARLSVDKKDQAEIQKLLDYAQLVAISKGPTKTYKEFVGKEALPVGDIKKAETALQSAVAKWCEQNGRSRHCRVRGYERGDDLLFCVVHGHRLEAPAVLKGDRHEVLRFRRVHSDFVRYGLADGRLFVTARSVQVVRALRSIFGEVIFKDPEFFSVHQTCSLEVLQMRGQEALDDHHISGIMDVRIVEASWKTPTGGRYHMRHDDCLVEIDLAGHASAVAEAELRSVTLRIDFNGKRGHRRVKLTEPNALSVPPDETAPLVYEYLRQIGVSNKAPPPKDDLWTLGMGSHPEGRWRVALGATEMNRLLSLNALANSRTSFAPSSEYTMDPYALTVLKAADGELIGADDDDEGPIQHLTPTDVSGLSLDLRRYGT